MGENKRKQTRFKDEHTFCCFCGGSVASEGVDHVPAKILFPNIHRPKGMEFPACNRCNFQSKSAEALLGVICRATGSGREHAVQDHDRLRDAMGSTETIFPGLLQKMSRGIEYRLVNGILRRFGIFDLNQEEVKAALCLVAAKMALAVFYEKQGRPAQESSIINTMWTHAFDREAKGSVDQILEMFPESIALQAGRWKTDDSFFVRTGKHTGNLFVASIFHESLFLGAEIIEGAVPEQIWMRLMTNTAAGGISEFAALWSSPQASRQGSSGP
jgi:hypothetical protein